MLSRWRRRLRDVRNRRRLEAELDEELRFHLEKEIEHQLAQGKTAAEARREALRQFGGVEQTKEQLREQHRFRRLGDLLEDVRYGGRMLRKSPVFTLVAILSLGLGIGASAALFGVAESLLLSTLPVAQPERLVLFEWEAGLAFRNSGTTGWSNDDPRTGRRSSSSFSQAIVDQLRQTPGALSDLIAFASLDGASLLANGHAEVRGGQYVSGNYFRTLGVQALLGRTLGEADDQPGAAPAAVISHRYWQTRFAGAPAVIGSKLVINTMPVTIVGVLPPAFTGTMQVDSRPVVMVPLALEPLLAPNSARPARDQPPSEPREDWWLNLMGRLAPGVTVAQAEAALHPAFQALALQMMPPPRRDDQPARLEPKDHPRLVASPGARGMLENRREHATTISWLAGAMALLLLIACANVANMLLARASARTGEITLRVALGAGRGRLVRQMLTESLLLALGGGVLGLLLALAGNQVLMAVARDGGGLFPAGVPYGPSWKLLGFTAGLSLGTVVLFGLVPALRATRLDLAVALNQGRRGPGGPAHARLSKGLVVAQVAMSLVLLLGAGLFLRTVRNLMTVELGFNQQNLLLFNLAPAGLGYEGERLESLYDRLFTRLEALPGVSSATFASIRLISGTVSTGRVVLPGETGRTAAEHPVDRMIVCENYLDTLEIPLLQGRGFTPADRDGAPRVAIVNELFARRYFPGRSALGARIAYGRDPDRKMEIVGVARDTKYHLLRRATRPLAYTPWRQADRVGGMAFAVRFAGPREDLEAAIRRVVQELEPNLPVTGVTTQAAQSRRNIAAERFTAKLLTLFGVLAALLAGIGLYGVMAYSVAQRTGEIGVRMALGAHARAVLRMVALQGLKFAVLGVVLGAIAAQILERVVKSQLYGVTAADPVTIVAVAGTLLAICLVACWIPAVRATRVDPVVALRSE